MSTTARLHAPLEEGGRRRTCWEEGSDSIIIKDIDSFNAEIV